MDEKKGNIIEDNIGYLIFTALFAVVFLAAVYHYKDSAVVWEDFYAKEIAKAIDVSEPGTEIEMDVHTATIIAKKNGVKRFRDIFIFNNERNEVCAKLTLGDRTCYRYFNNVKVFTIGEPVRLGKEKNILSFRIEEGDKNAG